MDILYKKLSNEFKDQLITIWKKENLNDLILSLSNMDTNIKKTSKQFQLCVNFNASSILAIKLPFKSYNLVPTKPFTSIRVAVVFPVLSTTTKTYPSPMNMSDVISYGPILQKEKDRCNNVSLCHYCRELRHIAIDNRNSALLASKKQAASALMGNLIALIPYTTLFIKEKETSLS